MRLEWDTIPTTLKVKDQKCLHQITKKIITHTKKKLRILGSEISNCYILLGNIKEFIKQSNENFEIYKKYINFFYDVYQQYHANLILSICKLIDRNERSLSITHMLEAEGFAETLDEIIKHETYTKVKKIRNKLGYAHLDKKTSTNEEKQQAIYNKNKLDIAKYSLFIELLKKAYLILSQRLEIPIFELIPTDNKIKLQIRNLFNDLKKQPQKLNQAIKKSSKLKKYLHPNFTPNQQQNSSDLHKA